MQKLHIPKKDRQKKRHGGEHLALARAVQFNLQDHTFTAIAACGAADQATLPPPGP